MSDNRDPSPGQKPEAETNRPTNWRAVGIVLVLFLSIPVGYQLVNWVEKSREANDKQATLIAAKGEYDRLQVEHKTSQDAAQKTFKDATDAEQAVAIKYSAEMAAARKILEEKNFTVRLTGPARIQPGAPNMWQIEALQLDGTAVKASRLEIAVTDASGAELFRDAHDKPGVATPLVLTTKFWENVKPGTDLFLKVVAFTDDKRVSSLAERIPLARPMYVTHLQTDKPLYKPGETVRFRSLTLERSTLRPPANDQHLRFSLRDPGDAVTQLDVGNGRLLRDLQPVMGPDKKPLRGIGVGEYVIPAGAPGGEYKLDLHEVTSENPHGVLIETRKFIVNRYVPDTFEKKLEFDGKSYGPGDVVQARIEVSRTAGGPMKNATALVVASVDGKSFHEQKDTKLAIEPTGKAVLNVRFKVPADLFEKSRKDVPSASLSVTIDDGSDLENILRPIPLVTKKLNIEFFPEGGEMIDGVSGRVYFQIRMPSKGTEPGKPADITGVITDGTNTVVPDIKTETDADNPGVNRGQGSFTLTPRAGAKYFLKLSSPSGITAPTPEGFPLPVAKADGVALTSLDAVTAQGATIRIRVQAAQAKTLHVGAYARGRLIAHQKVEAEAGKPVEVSLKGDDVGGVTRITVFEEPKGAPGAANLIPRAERLVYRKPAEMLMLNINPDKSSYTPGGKVKLELSAFNDKEKPTPAVLLVGVVNRSVITMADNKTDRLMPTHFILSGEVKHPAELEHADFLLTDHPRAAIALDLLLGTQGWRRFAEQTGAPGNPNDKTDVEKMLVAHGQRTSAPFELYRLEEQRINAEYRPKMEQTTIAMSVAQTELSEIQGAQGPGLAGRVATAKATFDAANKQHTETAAELNKYETRSRRIQSWALPALMVSLIALGISGLSLAGQKSGGSRRPYYLGSVALFALGACALGAIVMTRGTKDAEVAWDEIAPMRNAPLEFFARKAAPNAQAARDMAANERADFPLKAVDGDRGPRAVAPQAPAPLPPMMPAGPDALPQPKAGPRGEAKPADGKFDEAKKMAENVNRNPAQADAIQRDKARLANALAKEQQPGRGDFARPRPVPGGGPMGGMGQPAEPGFAGKGGFGGRGRPVIEVMPFVVREYAHQRDPALGEVRSDFTETVYWHPVLVLPESGKATVEFQLSDDIARYEVLVAGHTLDGRIGAITKTIEARKPFSVDPKLPLEVSHTDIIDVPVRVTNDSGDKRRVEFTTLATGFKADGIFADGLELAPNGKGRKIVRLKANKLQGEGSLLVTGTSGADKDSIQRTTTIVPDGFPGVGSFSDRMERRAAGSITLPKDVVPGTLKVRLEVYPTSLSDLVKGLDGLLREPYGCFEQTSTSNYPNTLILDYMNQTNQTNPEAAKKARGLLDKGYAKLVSFECPDTPQKTRQGFEWFGGADQQHEALTAYGLLQFKDMARVHTVDAQMIKRTQTYLLSRRDGQGGFKRNARALDNFGGAPKPTTDAYIVWALVESDPDDTEKLDLKTEIAALKTQALDENSAGGKDAYFVALVANVLLQRGDRQAAHQLLDRLKDKHAKAGAVTGAVTSITRSGGRDLEIETTAITLLGWLRANDPKYSTAIKESTKWISQQRGGYGGFGSTQSTIMALKALTLFANKAKHPSESGEIKVSVGGKVIGTRKFTEKDVEVIGLDIENPEAVFKPGETTEVEIVTDAKQSYPFALSYTYTTLTPISAEKCQVNISTKLAKTEANEGDTVPLTVNLENRQKAGQGMTVAIIGIPAGMKVPTDMKQLTDLREKGVISFFELRGSRELVLYWREMAPEQKVALTVDLVCDVPGEYRGPASRGYLYYNADHKCWVPPLAIKIVPKE